ncbi:hypothetical protein ACIG3E_33060 [Streptomyces sp. NPDC053474]|uniref:DUF6197 family protein n=1 Tax=Streptomyces sp. NPDC053474 TaxID=3365704 RepID=UPI0037D7A333
MIHPVGADNGTQSSEATIPARLSLEDRLTLCDAVMSVRLDQAHVAYEVNTAHILTQSSDLADIITVPLTPEAPTGPDYPTPIAALLHRAWHRLLTGGWCSDTLVDAQGARCMAGAIRAEARGDRALESRAVAVLLEAIQRVFGEAESVPSFNDTFASARVPLRMVAQAVDLASARGL